MSSSDEDDDLVGVLGKSILGAHRVLRDGKPQAAIDMIDIVLGALPPAGLETVEIAALPPKIVALSTANGTSSQGSESANRPRIAVVPSDPTITANVAETIVGVPQPSFSIGPAKY